MIDAQVAYDKLAQFQSAVEIAEFLESENIIGRRRCAFSCPIANFMSSLVGYTVSVGPGNMLIRRSLFMGLTDAMSEFVERFDTGEFPQLVDTSEL